MSSNALKKCIILSVVLISASLALSGANIKEFHARRDNNTVIIEWTTKGETNLERFLLKRSSDTINWNSLAEIPAKGGNTNAQLNYEYEDRSIFKNDGSGTFYYQLSTVDYNGTTTPHDVVTSISGSSGIRHTWGSIKAIFR